MARFFAIVGAGFVFLVLFEVVPFLTVLFFALVIPTASDEANRNVVAIAGILRLFLPAVAA
jgi:hypothetical protein